MARATQQDTQFLRQILITTGVALLIAFILLLITYLWLFEGLLS